jgi:protein phosphatase
MGGAAAGEMASKLGVQTLYREVQELVNSHRGSNEGVLEDILIEAVGTANRRIYQLGARNDELRGMGTTLTSVLELNGQLLIGQIGDSRAYLIRGDSIRQLTRDQSLVAQRVSAGILTEEQARRHPERNVLLQALGVRDSVELALRRLTVHPMDILLLCSDGLHGQMASEEMREIIAEAPGLDAASKRLIDLANSRGGPDNITTVLVEFLPARSMGFYQGIEDDESGLFDFPK